MQIYRFHEFVGVNPPTGETFYLDFEEARQLIASLSAIVNEADRGVSFVNGTTETTEIKTTGSRYRE